MNLRAASDLDTSFFVEDRPDRSSVGLTVDLDPIQKYHVRGPRYTSYPLATQFTEAVPAAELIEQIAHNNGPLVGDRVAGKVQEFLLSRPIKNSFESLPTFITA